ncbi:hypothetical protein MLAC_44330 [Mycobacterium lacus]|uniref:Uncharacterized protein n=1 Tax=Mycobacterium lacus TaxID=169765 RepID=A0A7I7NSA0_9MYCO|nr:hypothetical protein MLAC_44330 [Mycobacterium lacus]
MRTLTRSATFAAAVTVVSFLGATFAVDRAEAPPGSTGATTVVLDAALRRCDFSRIATAAMVPRPMLGTGIAFIHASRSSVVAEVRVTIPNQPGTHYDVGLIQHPRPSSATCGPGDPGTAFAGLDTDAAANGTVAIRDDIRPGTTGVWVIVARPTRIPGRVLHVRVRGARIGRHKPTRGLPLRPCAGLVRRPAPVRPR